MAIPLILGAQSEITMSACNSLLPEDRRRPERRPIGDPAKEPRDTWYWPFLRRADLLQSADYTIATAAAPLTFC